MIDVFAWLLDSDEPWTRYRTQVDLLERPPEDAEVITARKQMIAHEKVQQLITLAAGWDETPLKRHNDTRHPLHLLSTLADFGLRKDDKVLQQVIEKVFEHQSLEGPFQTFMLISSAFGGTNEAVWAWMACDYPLLVSTLLRLGFHQDPQVQKAVQILVDRVEENGYHCLVAPELGSFRGPGKRTDPCPIANVYALQALALLPVQHDSPAVRHAIEMLLTHWCSEFGTKYYLFGVGNKFRKLKYPLVWYDLLHVADVLSYFQMARSDDRFLDMLMKIQEEADDNGCYTPASVYLAWKGWSFADKKAPSPWLTFLILRILKRANLPLSLLE